MKCIFSSGLRARDLVLGSLMILFAVGLMLYRIADLPRPETLATKTFWLYRQHSLFAGPDLQPGGLRLDPWASLGLVAFGLVARPGGRPTVRRRAASTKVPRTAPKTPVPAAGDTAQALAVLQSIVEKTSALIDPPEILQVLQDQLSSRLGVRAGAAYLYNAVKGQLQVEVRWGWVSAALPLHGRFFASVWPYSVVIHEKKAVVVEDARQAARGHPLLSSGPCWSLLSVPLVARDQVEGILDVFCPAEADFSPERVRFFSTMGQQVGLALQNIRLLDQARLGRERLRSLSQHNLDVQETERRHIARELHDEIGQALTALKVNLQTIQNPTRHVPLDPTLFESIAIIDRTLQQVRNLSLDLRPSMLDDLGVVAAIRWYLDRQAQRAGFRTEFRAEPPEIRLAPNLETTCFRVVQEAITNVVRHAQASLVRVELRLDGGWLELIIQDDGVGFDVRAARVRAGGDPSLGLYGMEERVQLMGGQIEVQSDSTQQLGTEIRCRFPIQPETIIIEKRENRRESE